MKFFEISGEALSPEQLRLRLEDPSCGGYVAFEGWVRNNADGHNVNRLEYEAYESLAIAEGNRVLEEAIERFGVTRAKRLVLSRWCKMADILTGAST